MPEIIAETIELLVLNKPAGLIVHSDGRTEEPSVAAWLLQKYPALAEVGETWVSPQGEHVPLRGIVHRLDRTTSGVMLVAKTDEMYAYLKNEFKQRRVEKTYRAYVYGHMGSAQADSNPSRQGRIVAEIMRSSEPPRRWYARPCEESDKRAAITEWRLIKNLTTQDIYSSVLPVPGWGQKTAIETATAYIEVCPKTGRTHQIRVHFASIGHPLVADHLYASSDMPSLGFTRPALHAHSISLSLPDDTTTNFTAPLPADFLAISDA